MSIPRELIAGLVLSGGRGQRMGGSDKGLQPFQGAPMVMHTLMRLEPQVDVLSVNANRNLAAYESLGSTVIPDSIGDFAGPLAGFQAGLEMCEHIYMVTVPCDSPRFPSNLVEKLSEALLIQDLDIAYAATMEDGKVMSHPVFCLMKSTTITSLTTFLGGGGRKIDEWFKLNKTAPVIFDDAAAFANINTHEELRNLQK
jgi:molybdopterin-guanine dinucleotide biosynthesis protein A